MTGCKVTAHLLQRHCKPVAVALQSGCSITANRYAVMLQTVCSGTAKCMHSLCSEKSLLFTLLQYEYNEALSPSFRPAVYRLQKKDTNTGTLISINIPWNIAIGITSFPEYWVMEGRSTSIELTPAADIGASLPKYFRMSGAPSKAIISRKILASRAMVPSSVASCRPMEGSLNCVIRMEESE